MEEKNDPQTIVRFSVSDTNDPRSSTINEKKQNGVSGGLRSDPPGLQRPSGGHRLGQRRYKSVFRENSWIFFLTTQPLYSQTSL